MKFTELVSQVSTPIASYRQIIFKTFIIALSTGGSSNHVSGIFRRFTDLLNITNITRKRFYNFLNSAKLPWDSMWMILVKMLGSNAITDDRVLVALDDSTYGKTGKNIAGCDSHFDHAAKQNWSKWIFGHCRVVAGVLTFGHSRWMFLPFAQRNFRPLPKGTKNSKKLSYDEWLNTKSGIGASLVVKIAKLFRHKVLIVCDSWFGTEPLLKEAQEKSEYQIDLLSRLRINSTLFELPIEENEVKRGRKRKYGERLSPLRELAKQLKQDAVTDRIHIYGKERDCTFVEIICMSKALKRKIKVVLIYRGSYVFPIFTTDLTLTAQQMIEYYSARWKIESGFKELKHEVGILDSQCRNEQAVENHFNLGCYAMSLTWIYALQSKKAPSRMHPTRKTNAFAFADVRRKIATEIKSDVLNRGCHKTVIPAIKSICTCIFRIGA
jgi:hypothetical protein